MKEKEKEIMKEIMKAMTKFFDKTKGWGFISSNAKDYFVHYTGIKMDGYRYLEENDIVDFEVETLKDGREIAVNVVPILTMQMVKDALKDEGLHIKTIKDSHGAKKYLVVDGKNVIQSDEQGMSFLDLALYAGFSTSEEVA
jgi:CspA family cold shock protein